MLRLVMCVFLVSSTAAVRAGDWPQWRGPDGDGTSREAGVPTVWSEQAGIVWKAPLLAWGTSTPALWGNDVFLTAQSESGDLLYLQLEKSTGKVVRSEKIGTAETPRASEKRSTQKFHQLHNNASPSPVTDGKHVAVHFGNGDLAVFEVGGKKLWQRNLQQDFGPYSIWWGHANSPVIFGDKLISVCMQDSRTGLPGEPGRSYLIAHDLTTGKPVWTTPRETPAEAEQCDSYTTPLLRKVDGRDELILMGGNQLDAYDPQTGKLLRKFTIGLVGGRTITGPTLAQGLVICTPGMRGNIQAIKLDGTGELPAEAVVWKHAEATPDTCCPVVWGDLLFMVSDNGIAHCLDVRTGTVHWKKRLGGNFKASPIAAEGRIYFVNLEGTATVVAAEPEYRLIAENKLDDEFTASPAISDGKLFLRGRKSLYCIEKK